jgi:hypothetical protein
VVEGGSVTRRTYWVVGTTIALLALVAVPLLVGCGGTKAAADPFVGTWCEPGYQTQTSSTTPLIIAKTQDGYVATFVFWGPEEKPASPRPTLAMPLTRQGDKLVGTYKVPGVGDLRAEVGYLPQSGHLTWSNSRTPDGPMNKPDEMVKVSESTAIPTESP